VVDLGCGTGTLAIMVKQAHPDAEVFGLDADPEMLAVARAKAAEKGVDVTFDEGMTFALPYADGSFDRVLSSIMIHHLKTPDKERTAREVYRVLRNPDPASEKPGGQLHILDFGAPYTLYGKLLKPFLHEFEEVNDNVDGLLPEIFGRPGLKTQVTGNYWTFFGDLAFLYGQK
jgi:ubiquinone/menaquinone biosynthesis C-methylase UbiE